MATLQGKGSVRDIQAHLRHAKADTTANEYMQELPESVGRMVESMYEELMHNQAAASADLLPNATNEDGPYRYLYERYGRHEETRTPDLYVSRFSYSIPPTAYSGACE